MRFLFPVTAILVVAIVVPMSAHAQVSYPTFWIDESNNYNGNGCSSGNLNNVTGQLAARMYTNGWTGWRWVDAYAWPQDFWEDTYVGGGLESSAADSQTVSVYAGHATNGTYGAILDFSHAHAGSCQSWIPVVTRLGALAGNQSGYGMYLASCAMRMDNLLSNFGNNQVYQQFGFHNSPALNDDQAAAFFDDTLTVPNDQAWVDRMQTPGWFYYNSPVALTFAQSGSQCAAYQANAKLRARVLLAPSPEPWSHWCAVWRDNGPGPC